MYKQDVIIDLADEALLKARRPLTREERKTWQALGQRHRALSARWKAFQAEYRRLDSAFDADIIAYRERTGINDFYDPSAGATDPTTRTHILAAKTDLKRRLAFGDLSYEEIKACYAAALRGEE